MMTKNKTTNLEVVTPRAKAVKSKIAILLPTLARVKWKRKTAHKRKYNSNRRTPQTFKASKKMRQKKYNNLEKTLQIIMNVPVMRKLGSN